MRLRFAGYPRLQVVPHFSSGIVEQAKASERENHPTREKVQRAKKVLSNSPGLVDFAIGLVNSVLTCPTGK